MCGWVYGCVCVSLYVLFDVCLCKLVFTCIIVCCHPFPFTGICQLERKTTRFYISYRSYILRKTIYPSKQSCAAAVNEFVTLRMKFLRMLLPASPIFILFMVFVWYKCLRYFATSKYMFVILASNSMITQTLYFHKYSFPLSCCWIFFKLLNT